MAGPNELTLEAALWRRWRAADALILAGIGPLRPAHRSSYENAKEREKLK